MKKLIALALSLFVVTSSQAASNYFLLSLYSGGDSSPIFYDYRVYSNNGDVSAWLTVPANGNVLQNYPLNYVSKVEIKTYGSNNYGILDDCHQSLPLGIKNTTNPNIGPYWYVSGNFQYIITPHKKDGLTVRLFQWDSNADFTVLGCWIY